MSGKFNSSVKTLFITNFTETKHDYFNILARKARESQEILLKTQEYYKFYNHKIFHSPPVPSYKTAENTSRYYDFRGANFPGVANFDENYGNQIGTQHSLPETNNET